MTSRVLRKRIKFGGRRGARRRGFTLIEVLIVLAIVLLLGGLVGVTLFARRDQADVQLAQVDLNTLKSALKQFNFDYRRYPTDEEGIAVLWDRELLDPEADTAKYPPGGYLEEPMAEDRWGNEWVYRQEGDDFDPESGEPARYVLYSIGPDGEDGTDDDIHAWASAADEDMGSFGGDLMPPGGGG